MDERVVRSLYLEADLDHYRVPRFFLKRPWEERHNARELVSNVSGYRPDLVVFWGMWNLSRTLPAAAEKMQLPVAYYLEDLWPISPDLHTAYWRSPGRGLLSRALKSLGAAVALSMLRLAHYPPRLKFENAACGSQFIRDRLAGAIPAFGQAEVVMCGIDLDPFCSRSSHCLRGSDVVRMAYVGSLGRHKGVHTAIECLVHLKESAPDLKPVLTVVGTGHPEYERALRLLSTTLGVEDMLRFSGPVSKEQVPGILSQQDILVVPSVWEEPFGRVVVEGMAAGLVVIGTATGGSGEILADDINGLVFPKEDAPALAECIVRLARDPELYRRLSVAGRESSSFFCLSKMVDGLEAFFAETVSKSVEKRLQ
jgi:glycosyltransferase involved in cell wall biosynthesis